MTPEHHDIERRAKGRLGTTLLAKYRLDRLLGVGGMASVYAATHRNNQNRVAIKMLHGELSVNADIRARFLREGYLANRVGHPGAVRVLDDDMAEDGSVFIVMDLLDGETLGRRVERSGGKLGPVDAAAIAWEICDVLASAHGKGIVHRDIKPDNVFITRRGEVKVLDFGIARLRDTGGSSSTQTGQMVGTPAFMATEQALGSSEEVGPATDVWAVGATMFTLITGRFVHEARTNSELLVFAATRRAPPIAEVAGDVPAVLAAVVDRALAFSASDRFADAAAMRTALGEALAAVSPHGHAVAPAPSLSEQFALDDTDKHDRRALPSASASPSRRVVAPSRSGAPGTPVMPMAEVLGATVASGQGPGAVTPGGPTTTMGVASEGGPGRSRRAARLRASALVVVVGLACAGAAWKIGRQGSLADPATAPVVAPSIPATPAMQPAHSGVAPAASSVAEAPPPASTPSASHSAPSVRRAPLPAPPPGARAATPSAHPTAAQPDVGPLDRQ